VSIRYGRTFTTTYRFLQQSQWWSREKLAAYQRQELRKLLNHAYQNVPYYRKLFDERGLKPADIESLDDLKKLPFLTREIIRKNLSDLKARNYSDSKIEYLTTGGTTGLPFGFYQDRSCQSREQAFIFSLWERAGFKMGDRRVELRGSVVKSARRGKFWEYNPAEKSLILSSFHLTEENLPVYIKKIRDFKPDFIHAYPSVIVIMANYMKKNNTRPFSSLKAVLCASEKLYAWQRDLLEEAFQCRIFSFYGHSERSVLAGECEIGIYYHIFPEYGITELVGQDGKLISEADVSGEIVATGFNNYAMPFIRYRTGDIASYSQRKCRCGRNYPLLEKIEGRTQEYFIDNNGSLVTFIWADGPLWGVKDKINAYQYVQREPGRVMLKINPKNNLSASEVNQIKRVFSHFYSGIEIEIKFVNHIPRTERGKFRYFIQGLPVDFAANC